MYSLIPGLTLISLHRQRVTLLQVEQDTLQKNISKVFRRLRILVVTTSYPLAPDSVSGVFVARLAEALARCHAIMVLTPAGCNSEQSSDAIQVHQVGYAPKSWRIVAHQPGGIPAQLERKPLLWFVVPLLLFTLWVAILRRVNHVDIIHANWSICGVLAGLARFFRGPPLVTTLRGEDVNKAKRSVVAKFQLRLAVKLSTAVVVVSESLKEAALDLIGADSEKIVCIPNGVEAPSREQTNTYSPGRRLLAVGSLVRRKQVSTMIDAMGLLPEDYKLTVVGDGPELESLIARARKAAVDDRVAFLGSINPRRMSSLYQEHDLLVHAARSEGRPNVVVEALACGLPVVASDIPGVADMVHDSRAGNVFPVGDAASLAKEIRLILESPAEYASCAVAGPEWVLRNRLTWTACAERYTNLFESVVRD